MDRWDLLFVAGTLVSMLLPIILIFVGFGKAMESIAGQGSCAPYG
jgi:hypothetical protein